MSGLPNGITLDIGALVIAAIAVIYGIFSRTEFGKRLKARLYDTITFHTWYGKWKNLNYDWWFYSRHRSITITERILHLGLRNPGHDDHRQHQCWTGLLDGLDYADNGRITQWMDVEHWFLWCCVSSPGDVLATKTVPPPLFVGLGAPCPSPQIPDYENVLKITDLPAFRGLDGAITLRMEARIAVQLVLIHGQVGSVARSFDYEHPEIHVKLENALLTLKILQGNIGLMHIDFMDYPSGHHMHLIRQCHSMVQVHDVWYRGSDRRWFMLDESDRKVTQPITGGAATYRRSTAKDILIGVLRTAYAWPIGLDHSLPPEEQWMVVNIKAIVNSMLVIGEELRHTFALADEKEKIRAFLGQWMDVVFLLDAEKDFKDVWEGRRLLEELHIHMHNTFGRLARADLVVLINVPDNTPDNCLGLGPGEHVYDQASSQISAATGVQATSDQTYILLAAQIFIELVQGPRPIKFAAAWTWSKYYNGPGVFSIGTWD